MKRTLPTIEKLNEATRAGGNGVTRELLQSWGVCWPPNNGWIKALRYEILSRDATAILGGAGSKQWKGKRQGKSHTPSPNDPKNIKAFYASWEWKKVRMQALERDGHRCLSCGVSPKNLPSVRLVVDHIKPIRRNWGLRLDLNNLQVLCDDCNMGKGAWLEADFRPDSNESLDREWREITR